MIEYNIKLRNEAKKISLKNLNSDSIKIKFKLKGIYKNIKFKGEISLIIHSKNNKFEINKLIISDLDISGKNSSSNSLSKNVYTLSIFETNNDEKNIKHIYKYLKYFVNSLNIKIENNLIDSIVFNNINSNIKKINIIGYARKYY